MKIELNGSNVLRKKTKFTTPKDISINLLNQMYELMNKKDGIGLAAPQVDISKKFFILKTFTGFKTFINPIITEKFGNDITMVESCLSIPNKKVKVKRKNNIKIQYFDINWNLHKQEFTDIIARVIQHEYDHLNGILITDYEKKS